MNQTYQTKSIQSNLLNLIQQTNSTKPNLQKIEVKSNPSWAEFGPVQPQLVLMKIMFRYLGLPTRDDNLAGYQASDVTAKAKKLANKKYLMVHGTADDNVHYQQSMMLARAMEEADVLFK